MTMTAAGVGATSVDGDDNDDTDDNDVNDNNDSATPVATSPATVSGNSAAGLNVEMGVAGTVFLAALGFVGLI